jgi:hypothetical protein
MDFAARDSHSMVSSLHPLTSSRSVRPSRQHFCFRSVELSAFVVLFVMIVLSSFVSDAFASGNANFLGTWTTSPDVGAFTITSESGSGACVGTSSFQGYSLINCHVTGNNYVFTITAGGGYSSKNMGVISGNTLKGSFTDSNNTSVGYVATRSQTASLLVKVQLAKNTVGANSQTTATVTVSAVGGKVDAIDLGTGIGSTTPSVAQTKPMTVPSFDLTKGKSRKIVYSITTKSAGSTVINLVASGTTTSGQAVQSSGRANLKVVGDTVTGTIEYLYLSGNGYASGSPASSPSTPTPARDTEVEILDANQTSCLTKVLSKVFTNDSGVYTSAPLPHGQVYFCAKILAVTEYSSVAASSSADPYASDPIGPEQLSTAGSTMLSWKPTSGSDTIDQAMDINNAVVTGASWLKLYGRTPTMVTITYPYPASSGVSNFSTSGAGEINADDAFDWSVLLHEYGHYVASLLGIRNTTSVASHKHEALWNMTNHERSKAEGIAIAWNEGFADFFSQMVQRAMDTASLHLPDVGASPPIYIDQLNGKTVALDLAASGASSPYPSKGEDNEPSVARVLWDLYSQPMFGGSSGSIDFIRDIATPMTSDDVRNLSGAVSSLEQTEHAVPWIPNLAISPTNVPIPAGFNQENAATIFGAVLSNQNVSPTIMSALVTSQGDSIEVNWRAGQPFDATDQSNLFLVQVWDPTWHTLLTEQVVARTANQKGNRTYRATLSIPKGVSSSVLHVVVLGWNAKANVSHLGVSATFNGWKYFGFQPVTGPYISASVDVHV